MDELLVAIAGAFAVVFVAELGDKTQLLSLAFGARYRLRVVAIGLAIGFGAASAVASAVGGALGASLPERPLAIAAGLLFLLFAVLALRRADEDDEASRTVRTGSVVASIALTIALAELGDKTQLATAALAARNHPVGTWVGATGGEVTAAMVGAWAGRRLGHLISPHALRIASAVLFAVFGIAMLLTA